MKRKDSSFLLVLIFTCISLQVSSQGLVDEDQLRIEAKQIVKEFGGTLKPKLIDAIQSGGLVHAIDFCSIEAPKIAEDLSEKTGWNVTRVSLKARNSSTAVPDDFEKSVLETFNEQQLAGLAAAEMSYSAVENDEFRYMSAQGVDGVCLSCHGQSLSTEVQQALDEHYPGDTATGYSLGEIRGAFSLTKPL